MRRYILSGKSAITSSISQALGGFGGLYAQVSNITSTSSTGQWSVVSASTETLITATSNRGHAVSDVIIQTFDPFDAVNEDAAMSEVAQDNEIWTDLLSPYAMAAQRCVEIPLPNSPRFM